MSVNWPQYSLAELREHATHTFRQGGGSRPDVLLIEIEGESAVLKDQSGADKLFATLLGPILNWRECKALKKLATLDSTPNLLSVPNKRSFLMTYHESEQITRLDKVQPEWPVFYDELSIAIEKMHAAGVAHNDLRNPTNILINADNKPILVDLVACFCQGKSWNLPNQWIFKKFCQVDRSAITKVKSRITPELITDKDITQEEIAGKFGMAMKGTGQFIRRLSRKFLTK